MKRTYVADLKPDDSVDDVFRVVAARLAPYRDEHKGQYMHLLLGDRTGQVEARLWQGAEAVAGWLTAGDLVRVEGRAKLYEDRLRLRIDRLEPAGQLGPGLAELFGPPAVDLGDALQVIHAAIVRISQPSLHKLLKSIFEDGDVLSLASLVPPERPGELLARIAELVELTSALVHASAGLDADLLLAAVLLHELGAVQAAPGGVGAKAVTWLGVPALSDQLLVERLSHRPDFPAGLAVDLRHCILAVANPSAARSREARVLIGLRQLQTALHET
jgi:3'-5' exoribonuclease